MEVQAKVAVMVKVDSRKGRPVILSSGSLQVKDRQKKRLKKQKPSKKRTG